MISLICLQNLMQIIILSNFFIIFLKNIKFLSFPVPDMQFVLLFASVLKMLLPSDQLIRCASLSYLVWNFNGITLMGFHKAKWIKPFFEISSPMRCLQNDSFFLSWALVISNVIHFNFVIISLAVLLRFLDNSSGLIRAVLFF